MVNCDKCDHKRKAEKYKRKYEMAMSGLTKEERNILIELICNEQLKHLVVNDEYESEKYKLLEELKYKVRTI